MVSTNSLKSSRYLSVLISDGKPKLRAFSYLFCLKAAARLLRPAEEKSFSEIFKCVKQVDVGLITKSEISSM